MNRFTHFSRHALKRIEQRTSLTYLEIAKILDCHMFVDIGREPGFNREHRLFYNIKDSAHFIAIQDIHTGGVVTILPLDYHENISWKIKGNQLKAAQLIASKPTIEYENYEKVDSDKHLPSIFIIAAHFNDEEGNQKTKEILKIEAEQYNRDLPLLLKCESLEMRVNESFVKKGISSASVWSVSIRLGKNGERVYFSWTEKGLS